MRSVVHTRPEVRFLPSTLLISIPSKHAVSQVIGFIKGKSAIRIARTHGAIFLFESIPLESPADSSFTSDLLDISGPLL